MNGPDADAAAASKTAGRLTPAEFLATLRTLADPALRASLEKLAEPAALEALRDAGDLHRAAGTIGGPELAAALEKFSSPAVQQALRNASAALVAPQQTAAPASEPC